MSAERTRGAGVLPADAPARSLMKDRAYAELKRLILSGELAPGSFLAERQLAARLGMSKTPVRSALERLEAEGFLSISPQQGAIVRELSLQEVADQYEIRQAVESYVARALAGRLTPAQVALLRENLDAQRANLGPADVTLAVTLDGAFHAAFCEFLGNQEILRVMRQLRDKTQRVISRVFHLNPGRLVSSYEEHVGIVDAVIGGDPAAASRRVEEHLRFGKEALLSPGRA